MNEYDSNRIISLVKKIGYDRTKILSEANCYILNTCHIREKATDKVYHDIGRVKKEFRNKKKPILLVTGCVAQAEGDVLLKKESYIDGVIGPQSYQKINTIIKEIEDKSNKINSTEFDVDEKFDQLNLIKNQDTKVSSFLTIQEGCDKFCKFCVVPYTRGPEHSRPFSQIFSEARELVDNGSKEITLLGQNVNAYKHEKNKLSDLIFKLSSIRGLDRIRYTTSHPKDVTEDLIEAHGSCKKLMPLLHLPVQSGSTKILKEMNRKHSLKEYINIVQRLKTKNPSIEFSSDFIIAYPGENDNDFLDTVNLMEKIKFINTYSFLYSPRPGTPAAELETIDIIKAKKRLEIFQDIAKNIKTKYRKKLVKTTATVLFENQIKNENKYFGRDEYSNSVIVQSDKNLIGQIIKVQIENFNQNTLFGNIASNSVQPIFA